VEDLAALLKQRDDVASVRQLLAQLTQADPQGPDLLGSRANLQARLGQWELAIADLHRAIRLDPSRQDLYHPLAVLLVQKGELAAYAQLCQQILVRFGDTAHARVAERASKDCLIMPVPNLELETINRLTDIAVNADRQNSGLPWSQLAKALAEYRQSRFASAAHWARQTLGKPHPVRDIEASMILAMSLHKLGQAEAASDTFQQGTRHARDQLYCSNPTDLGKDWIDWLIAQALAREASDTIQGELTSSQGANQEAASDLSER
jgi:tetratricopeptide (TPR) repeat protein